MNNKGKYKLKDTKGLIWNCIVATAILCLIWYITNLFMIATFKIPSPSMHPTLLPGDHIIVNKMAYGARLFDPTKKIRPCDITRLWGYSEMKRNDIIVFNYPYHLGWDTISFNTSHYVVKRCIALPGDTIEIINGRYHVRGLNALLGNIEAQDKTERVTRNPEDININEIAYWAAPFWHPVYHWNIREYGPLYVPNKGDVIILDTINAPIYKKYIEWEIGSKITNIGNDFYAGDSLIAAHTMQQAYCFVAGDNNLDSQDSRYWGLVPTDFIVGRAMMIWYSKDLSSGNIRWDRTTLLVD